mgnify:CR=1 FL=1
MTRSTGRLFAEIHEEVMDLVGYAPEDPEMRVVVLGLADELYCELIAEYFGQPFEELAARSPRYRDAVHRWMPSVAA